VRGDVFYMSGVRGRSVLGKVCIGVRVRREDDLSHSLFTGTSVQRGDVWFMNKTSNVSDTMRYDADKKKKEIIQGGRGRRGCISVLNCSVHKNLAAPALLHSPLLSLPFILHCSGSWKDTS
jgi:hypothetical protein